MTRVAVIPGDGIGPEAVREATQVLRTVARCSGKNLETVEFDFGAERPEVSPQRCRGRRD